MLKMNPVYQKKYVIPFKKNIKSKIREFAYDRGIDLPNITVNSMNLGLKTKNSNLHNRMNKSTADNSTTKNSQRMTMTATFMENRLLQKMNYNKCKFLSML
jgi:hypothetical protein